MTAVRARGMLPDVTLGAAQTWFEARHAAWRQVRDTVVAESSLSGPGLAFARLHTAATYLALVCPIDGPVPVAEIDMRSCGLGDHAAAEAIEAYGGWLGVIMLDALAELTVIEPEHAPPDDADLIAPVIGTLWTAHRTICRPLRDAAGFAGDDMAVRRAALDFAADGLAEAIATDEDRCMRLMQFYASRRRTYGPPPLPERDPYRGLLDFEDAQPVHRP